MSLKSEHHRLRREPEQAATVHCSASPESCRSMNIVKARALALACRPLGNAAQSSPGGKDQSVRTSLTAPDFSSGVNIHSDPPTETPRPANTPPGHLRLRSREAVRSPLRKPRPILDERSRSGRLEADHK